MAKVIWSIYSRVGVRWVSCALPFDRDYVLSLIEAWALPELYWLVDSSGVEVAYCYGRALFKLELVKEIKHKQTKNEWIISRIKNDPELYQDVRMRRISVRQVAERLSESSATVGRAVKAIREG